MKKVIIESPYAGDVEKNVRYARRATLTAFVAARPRLYLIFFIHKRES